MAKLFADRLNILESKINAFTTAQGGTIQPVSELQNRIEELGAELRETQAELSETNAKIKQIIDEITPIITSYANALKALLNNSV